MYNHKIITAGLKDDIIKIFEFQKFDNEDIEDAIKLIYENDPETNKPKINNYFKTLAAWIFARNQEPYDLIDSLEKAIRATRNRPIEERLQIDDIRVRLDAVFIKNKELTTYVQLAEYIHEKYPKVVVDELKTIQPNEEKENVVFDANGIKIFEINDIEQSREAANGTKWCIGEKGGSNMWQYYRDNFASSFFIVHDQNPPDANLSKVAIDFQKQYITLTDILNHTGSTLSNGWRWEQYKEYLSSKNVNLNATRINPTTNEEELIFQNKPIDKKQVLQTATFRLIIRLDLDDVKRWQNQRCKVRPDDLDFFPELTNPIQASERRFIYEVDNPDAINYLSRWLGLGLKIEDDVFDYLLSSTSSQPLMEKYLNTFVDLPEEQIQKIENNKSWLTTYLRKQIQKTEAKMPGDRYLLNSLFLRIVNLNNEALLKEYVKIANLGSTGNKLDVGGYGITNSYSCQGEYIIEDPAFDPELKQIIKENIITKKDFNPMFGVKLYDFDNPNDKALFNKIENRYSLTKLVKDDPRFIQLQDTNPKVIKFKDANFAGSVEHAMTFRFDEFGFDKNQYGEDKYTISPAGYFLAMLVEGIKDPSQFSYINYFNDKIDNETNPESIQKIEKFKNDLNTSQNNIDFWNDLIKNLPEYFEAGNMFLQDTTYQKLITVLPTDVKTNKQIIELILTAQRATPSRILFTYDNLEIESQNLVDVTIEKIVTNLSSFYSIFTWAKDAKTYLPWDVLSALMKKDPTIINQIKDNPQIANLSGSNRIDEDRSNILKSMVDAYFINYPDAQNVDIETVYNAYFMNRKKLSTMDEYTLLRQPTTFKKLIDQYSLWVIAKISSQTLLQISKDDPNLQEIIKEELKRSGNIFYTPDELALFLNDENNEEQFKEAKIKTLLKIANLLDKKEKYMLADVITMKMKNPL